MTRTCSRRFVPALGAVGLLAGCSILAPQPDPSRFFVLAPLPNASERLPGTESDPLPTMILGLGPIKMPPYLDRHEIATHLSPTQITYSPVNRWAEPLDVSVSRVLLQNLSVLLGTDRIARYPWSNATAVDYQILLEVLRFDTTEAGEAHLSVRWGIQNGRTQQFVAVRQTNRTQPAAPMNDPAAAAVAALSTTLGVLSEEIAATVRQLPRPRDTAPAAPKNS